MTRKLDFDSQDYRDLGRALSLGMVNGPYTVYSSEHGARILDLGQVVQEVIDSDWLRNVRHQAWLQGFQAGEEDMLHHEATSFDEPCLKSSKSPYALEGNDAL